MRIAGIAALSGVAGLFGMLALPTLAQQASEPTVAYAWSPKPDTIRPYGPNRPITRLKEVLAAHKGQASWSSDILQTKRWSAKWIQMAPGEKTRAQFYGDDSFSRWCRRAQNRSLCNVALNHNMLNIQQL